MKLKFAAAGIIGAAAGAALLATASPAAAQTGCSPALLCEVRDNIEDAVNAPGENIAAALDVGPEIGDALDVPTRVGNTLLSPFFIPDPITGEAGPGNIENALNVGGNISEAADVGGNISEALNNAAKNLGLAPQDDE